jgi:ABC-2 type transport system ATP-binding protein
VRFVLRLKGFSSSEAKRRADDVLERTRAAPFADKKIYSMSRGMRQRIKLCAALAHGPEILILDEPLTGSDALARAEILGLIREFGAASRTVLMSTHVLQEIEELTDQIVLLHRGRLLAQGRVREIRALIDRHPHEIRVSTPRARELASRLAHEPDVRTLQLEGSTLVVRTSSPSTFYPALTRVLAEEDDFGVTQLTSPDDNLEAVFAYLTEK